MDFHCNFMKGSSVLCNDEYSNKHKAHKCIYNTFID